MSGPRRAWVLNLDAEEELATRGSYTPSTHTRRLVETQRTRVATELLRPGDLLVTEENASLLASEGGLHDFVGATWSPTPRAMRLLAAAGVERTSEVALEVLRRVNGRPFASEVRASLGDHALEKWTVLTLEEALSHLSRPAELGWLVRRTFGAAGRGRRRIRAGAPDASEARWLEASLREGPLTIEPWVEVLEEFTRSAHVDAAGRVRIAAPTTQLTNEHGAWLGSNEAGVDEVRGRVDHALQGAVEATGAALSLAGYRGPFGIDAYLHRWRGGVALNPLSEVNARYTMDWALGFGARRPDEAAAGT